MADNKVTIEIAAKDAFSKTLITLQDELKDMQAKAGTAFSAGPSAIQKEMAELQKAVKKTSEGITTVGKDFSAATNKSSESVGGLNLALGSMAQFAVAAFSVNAIKSFIKETFNASLQMDAIDSKLKVVTGSSQGAGEEWKFISEEAKRLGLDLQQTAEAYSSFAVASKNTSMEGEPARRMFSAVSEAASAIHLPAEKSTAVLYQFQQMLSKGKVNMEDLKTASESFPGLLEKMATGLGLTTAELMNQMQKGQVMATDALPALAKELHATYGVSAEEAAKQGRGALNTFNSEVFKTKSAFGSALQPAIAMVMGGAEKLVFAFKNLISYVEIMGIGIPAAFDKAAVYAKAFFNGDLFSDAGKQRVKKSLDVINDAAGGAFADLERKYGILNDNLNNTNAKAAAEDARNSQRRRNEAKKTGEELAKINEEYAKQSGNADAALSAEMEKAYRDRMKAAENYYNQKKAMAKDNKEELAWERVKNDALKALEQQHARDGEIIQARAVQRAVDLRKEGLNQEILAIRQQAVDRVITEQQAEQSITILTLAAAKEQYESRKLVADRISAIYGQGSEDYKKALKEQEASFKAYTDANLAAQKKYADKVKEIEKGIADFRASIQEKISDLRQRGMSEDQKYADNQKRFNEALSQSFLAYSAQDYENALKYNKQAEALASRLSDTQAEGVDGVAAATEALQKVQDNGVMIMKKQKSEAVDALEKVKEIAATKFDPKAIEIKLDEAALASTKAAMNDLTKTEKKTIILETVGGGSSPSYTGMATGGKLPGGDSAFDSIPVMARPGEWFIRNEAAHFWGDELMSVFNNPFGGAGKDVMARLGGFVRSTPQLPVAKMAFAGGGPVTAPVDMGSITINIGGGSYPVTGKIDVLNELKTALRREALVRQQ
ncbi:MAG: hypothetical protein CXR31_04480 [Geobacter sp.]|nr:MAG: hypothetical protein CXR31_04480 [Geobacter sp.]